MAADTTQAPDTTPSLITSFAYTLQSCGWIWIGLWFSTNKILITERTLQLPGFSIAAHILEIHCEQSRNSTKCTLPQLDSYWVRGRSDTKMAALASPIASPRQNVSYFLDSPRRCNNNGLLIIPVSSTCFGKLYCPSSGALDCVLQRVV